MDALSYKTISATKANSVKEWIVVDAEGHNLGRLASKVAMILRGKYKPSYTPHVDCGDNVIVINSEKINLTGTKILQAKNPALLVEKAVKGMLPKNKLGAELFRNLNVVVGSEHKQGAQKPRTVNLNDLK